MIACEVERQAGRKEVEAEMAKWRGGREVEAESVADWGEVDLGNGNVESDSCEVESVAGREGVWRSSW